MRLSIIIPVYQTVAHLEACVRSVLDQHFTDFEIILIDDGSNDGSAAICQHFADQDPRIQFHQQSNQGVSSARNLGLSHASGDYLTFLDSDDTLTPEALTKAGQMLTTHRPDLIIFSINHLNLSEQQTTSHPWRVEDRVYESGSAFVSDLLSGQRLLLYSCANKFYRHDLITRHGISFRPGIHFGEDRLFNFEVFRHAQKILTSVDPSFNYHSRDAVSLSTKYRPQHIVELLALHRAKQEWIDSIQPHQESRSTFLATDLHFELRMAWRHLLRHWPQLSSQDRRREILALTNADYPPYLKRLKPHSLGTRIKLSLIEQRMTTVLHLLINIISALNAK